MQLSNNAFRFMLGPGWWAPSANRLRQAVGGRVVLVTGASSGIGAATATRLGAAGAQVLLVARRLELLEEVRSEIVAAGGHAEVHATDLTDLDAVDALVRDVQTRHGGVDVVINNAGKSIRRSLADTTNRFHDVTRSNDLNYLGPVRLLTGLLPAMRARCRGHVVNVSTVSVDVPAAYWAVYTASKSAFEGWLRCIAPEVRVDGIATTSVHFPLVHTAMSDPVYAKVPGLSADDAAGAIARALVTRRRLVCPWWVRLIAPLLHVAQGPYDWGAARVLRLSLRLRRSRSMD